MRKARSEKVSLPIGPWVLRSASEAEEGSFDKPSEFAAALRKSMSEANDIELLFALWEQNVDTVRALNRSLKQEQLPKSGIAPQLVSHLKQCAIALAKPEGQANGHGHTSVAGTPTKPVSTKIDKSILVFGEPKRIRCKEHLRFVASQPCLICGRSPSHAHHVRYAQSKGLSLKVSDEFTDFALRHTPPPDPHHRQGAGVVATAKYRPAQNCEWPLAAEPPAVSSNSRS